MKLFFYVLFAFLFFSHAYGQSPPPGAQFKYLSNEDGEERKIVYYPNSKTYYLCGGPYTTMRRVLPTERILEKACSCAPIGLIHPVLPTSAPFGNIQFDFDSSTLRTSAYPVLDATSADLRSGAGTIEIEGFASSEGTTAYNLRLSKDRANSVRTYLVNSGVDPKRIKVKGYGETKPVADNSTEEGRIMNRRVEFKKQ